MTPTYDQGDKPVPGYRLEQFLGRGGFGQVWRATGPGGTEIALKVIDLQGGRQGLKEFRALRLVKHIRHPNLTPITAYWFKDRDGHVLEDEQLAQGDLTRFQAVRPAELIIAMGLGDQSLHGRLQECRAQGLPGIPTAELLKYLDGAADALDFLNKPCHDLGQGPVAIQHGDVKPQNVLIVGGAAQLCDFGLARVLGSHRTTTPTASYAYVAPEVLESAPTQWTDQYALAISYHELRTGALPFTVTSVPMVLRAHAEGKLDLSRLAPAEQAVIKKATALKPEDRYPTTVEMVQALRRAVEGPGVVGSGVHRVPMGPGGVLVPVPGLEIVPGYRLVSYLGGGSYGKVWEAAAPGGIHVALKLIENLSGSSGRQEFKALELIRRVEHQYLMDLLAFWLLDREGQLITDEARARPDPPQAAVLIIACKLARGNLAQRLRECLERTGQGIPPLELLRYARQAAKAIDHLNAPIHQLDGDKKVSIQHRDIKPENILLAGDVVKVADFGLAKVLEGTVAQIHTGSAGLTLAYAAPELFENQVTQWTDQYALAITYYQLRTGVLPFANASSPNEIIAAHLYGTLDLSRAGEAEQAVLRRATAITPEARFGSCMELVEALYRAVFGSQADLEGESWPDEQGQAEEVHRPLPPTPAPAPLPLPPVSATQPTVPGRAFAEALLGSRPVTVPPRGDLAPVRPPGPLPPTEDDVQVDWHEAPPAEPPADGGEAFASLGPLLMERGTLLPSGHLPRPSRRQPALSLAELESPPPLPGPVPRRLGIILAVAALLGLGTLGGLAAWWLMGDREGQAAATGTTPDPLADTPPEPTAPVPDRGVAELLRQGAADLDGGHAGTARALFSSAAERPEATPGQVRRALLGRARAQARLGFWELARKDLARLDGVAGPPLDGADLANRQALDVLTAPPGPDLLGPLAGLRGGPALEAMAAWERAEVLQRGRLVVGQALDRVSATADPKAALALTRAILKYQPDEPAALAELPPLEALELAADGARKAPAADALIRLLTGHPPPPRLAALFQALVGLAEKDPALLAKAVPALDQARPLLPAGQDALLDRHDQLRQQLAGMGTPGPGSILAAAEKAWQAGQPAQARNRLGQVQAGQLSGAERGRYDRLAEALALQEGLQSRDRAARAAAVRQFPEVIARGGAGRPLILFQALADLARDEDAYLEEAVALLEHGLGPRGPLPLEDQKVVGERLAELLARLVAARVPKFDRSTDWGAWLERCARARRTGWVLGCRAEALLEKQRGPVPPEVLAQARKLAFDPAVAEETGAYGAYLRARVEQAAGRPREAVAEVLTIDPVSDLLRAAFRRGQLAEVLLAFVPSDLRAAHVALAGLPAAGVTWNAPAVKNATALLQTAREELTRLQAFDPDQARVLLNSAEVKALADRLAPVLDQWADRGVETGARKGGKVPDGAAALGLARECGELLIILGRTIPGAQWVGKACDLLEDPDAALRGLEAGLPPGLALDQLTPAHLPLLFQRHYLIVTHGAHFAPRIPAPQGVLGPAEAAVPLADRALAEARRAAEQGGPKDKAAAERARQATNQLAEARGVAGWANRHVIMLQPNNPGPGQIRKWRLAALGHFREALALAPGHPFAGSWRLLFAEQVAALRDGEAQDQAAADQNRAEALRYVGEALRAANLSAEDRALLELFRNQLQK